VLEWTTRHSNLNAAQVAQPLRVGDPPIAILLEGERTLRIEVWTLQGDEHELVTARLTAVFR
jgi:hypothetical protein